MTTELLAPGRFPLLVSLPRNDAALARAARDAGADGVKVHLNVEHRASGTRFGSLAEERDAIAAVLEVGLPTGVVVGGDGAITASEVRGVVDLGAAFVDAYAAHAPAWYAEVARPAAAVVAVGHEDPPGVADGLAALGLDAVEASLVPPTSYRTPLHLARVAQYADLARRTPLPLVVPSQHAITPEDVPVLRRAGAGALLIGAVVTGADPDQLGRVTRAFVEAIRTRT